MPILPRYLVVKHRVEAKIVGVYKTKDEAQMILERAKQQAAFPEEYEMFELVTND